MRPISAARTPPTSLRAASPGPAGVALLSASGAVVSAPPLLILGSPPSLVAAASASAAASGSGRPGPGGDDRLRQAEGIRLFFIGHHRHADRRCPGDAEGGRAGEDEGGDRTRQQEGR